MITNTLWGSLTAICSNVTAYDQNMNTTKDQYLTRIESKYDLVRKDIAIRNAFSTLLDSEGCESKKEALKKVMDVYLLRECCSLVLIDMQTCISCMSNGEDTHVLYENKFFLKHIKATMVEGYSLICLKDDNKKNSNWYNTGLAVAFLNDNELRLKYYDIDAQLEGFRSGRSITRFRNVVYHYDSDPSKVFTQIKNIKSSEQILNRAKDFCNVLDQAVLFADEVIAAIEKNFDIATPDVSITSLNGKENKHREMDSINQGGNAVNLFSHVIGKTVLHIVDTNLMYNGLAEFNNLYNKLPDIPEIGFAKPKFEEYDFSLASLSCYQYVYFATIDISTLLTAYFNALSLVPKIFLLRRIHICALAILQKIYVVDETSNEVVDGYWKTINDELTKTEDYNYDVGDIVSNLKALNDKVLSTFDRHVFAHYYKGHRPEVERFVQKLESMEPAVEIGKALMFIDTLQKIQDCLYGLLLNRAEALDRITKENYEQLKENWSKTKENISKLQDANYKDAMTRLATEFERQIDEINNNTISE